jgi:hypothetical protein
MHTVPNLLESTHSIIERVWIWTVDDQNLYEHGTVLVNDGEITDVRPSKPEDGELDGETVI